MSEFIHPSLDHIVALQGIQISASRLGSVGAKMAHIKDCLLESDIKDIFDRSCAVTTSLALGKSLDTEEDDRVLFTEGVVFSGTVSSCNYLYDRDIPLDSLALTFKDPTLMTASINGDSLPIERLYIPVLAIESCFDLPSLFDQ